MCDGGSVFVMLRWGLSFCHVAVGAQCFSTPDVMCSKKSMKDLL